VDEVTPMDEVLCVTTTTERQEESRQLAKALVQQNLAACVQVIGPIESTYRWEGEVRHATEWLCVAKTTRRKFDKLREAIGKLHSYDEPEIIATPVVDGSPGYLAWVRSAVE
jgi:periplasmic divalent cation tolerance protein